MSDLMELPCVKCGNAACALDLRGALEVIPAKYLYAIRGAARLSGAPIDKDSPSLGQDATEIAQVVGATCIECVDDANHHNPELAERLATMPVEAVDNNPGEAK